MKKIGILTFHFADNYGAVLQCYALRRIINGLTGCRAEVINYVPASFQYVKTWINEYEKSLFREKRKSFEKFLSEHCGIQKQVIHTISEAGLYDYYVVGSDQVWSTSMQEYFLPEVADKSYCISYAASIGVGMDNSRLRKSVLQQYVPKFKFVSVREYEHVEFIEKVCGKKCECLLDPVLLLDVVDYEDFIAKENLREEKFIFFFWLTHDKEYMHGVEFVNRLSRLLELPIVHAFQFAPDYMFCNDGGSMQFEGIENFLWYVKSAEYVVTNSYHATLFSIQFHTPFYIFASRSMRSRIDTLCRRFSIRERVVEGYLPMDRVHKDIKFDSIYRKIQEQRKDSFQYLHKALGAAYE